MTSRIVTVACAAILLSTLTGHADHRGCDHLRDDAVLRVTVGDDRFYTAGTFPGSSFGIWRESNGYHGLQQRQQQCFDDALGEEITVTPDTRVWP